jgi:hypothetical protein
LNRLCHIRNRYQDEGHLYITYPAQAGADHGDVFLTTSHDGGKTWSAHVRANDDATQTDQWMPSVAVTDEGIVGVMFYDGRNDPLNNLKMDVYLAISTNHGHGFHSNQRITNTSFPPAVHFDPSSLLTPWRLQPDGGRRRPLLPVWGDNRDFVGARHDPNVYFATFQVDD